jgi:hypothetical protein
VTVTQNLNIILEPYWSCETNPGRPLAASHLQIVTNAALMGTPRCRMWTAHKNIADQNLLDTSLLRICSLVDILSPNRNPEAFTSTVDPINPDCSTFTCDCLDDHICLSTTTGALAISRLPSHFLSTSRPNFYAFSQTYPTTTSNDSK